MKRDFYKPLGANSAAGSIVIELSATELSVLVLDSTEKLIGYSYHSTSFKLEEDDYFSEIEKCLLVVKEELKPTVEVKLFLDNPKISFIPEKYYNAADALQQFSLQHGKPAKSSLLKESNIAENAFAIFEYSQRLQDLVINVFGSCKLFHSYDVQATDCFTDLLVSIIFHKYYFNICIKKDGQLQIVRHYSFESEADVLYHILNAFKQLDINVEGTSIGLCGAIDQSSPLYKTLNEFLFDLKFLNAAVEVAEDEAPAHYFYHPLQFNKCVS